MSSLNMINAKTAKVKSLKNKAKIEKVDYRQVNKLKREIIKAIKKATKQGLFEASIVDVEIDCSTLMALKSILLSKCFFYTLNKKVLTVYWE